MAFAPPRPQSIFGRSAPPQAQIDWRLGAQVGQNIGGGIQSAMQHLSKGFVDWQEGVAEGRRKDKIGELLRGQFPGMSDKEIKGGQENPNFLLGLKQIEQQAAKIKADAERQDAAVVRQIAAQQLAQQKFALEEDRFGLEEERFDIAKKAASQDTAKHEVDMGTRVREIAADITYMDKGELKIDPFELSRIHPALQKALLRVPRSELKTIEEDQGAYESMMEKARRPKKKGVKFVEETFTAKEHQHWAGLDDRDKMRLTGERPTMVIIGGSQQAKEWEEATGLKLEASVVISPVMPRSLRKSQQPETTDSESGQTESKDS